MNPFAFFPAFAFVIVAVVLYLAWIERQAIAAWIFQQLLDNVVAVRDADFYIGGRERPYLVRWYLLGTEPDPTRPDKVRSRSFCGLRPYLHCFKRSDDDRAHHDHPAWSLSLALHGQGAEETIARGGLRHKAPIRAGDIRLRSAKFAHRIEIEPGEQLWTLFVFGPNVRDWGFHCPNEGWIPWQRFTAADDAGAIGPGCDG